MPTRSTSGRLSLVGTFGDEESFRVYREEEADAATGLPLSRDLQRLLERGGSDLHPAREVTLTDLDGHAYHLCALPLYLPQRDRVVSASRMSLLPSTGSEVVVGGR